MAVEEKTTNEAFLDAMLAHQIYILRYGSTVRNKIISLLNDTEAQISETIIGKLGSSVGLVSIAQYNRLKRIKETIAKVRRDAWKEAHNLLLIELQSLAIAEPEFINSIISAVVPVQLSLTIPDARLLKSIATTRPFEGQLLKQWVSDVSASDMKSIMRTVQRGMVEGLASKDIARLVIGTATARGIDGITQKTRNGIDALVGTAVQHIANQARFEFFNENVDIIEMEEFVATLDARTTLQCMGFDGKRFPHGKGPLPPLHMRCRSLRIAWFDGVVLGNRPMKPTTERQLLREFSQQQNSSVVTRRDRLAYGTRGRFDAFARKRIRQMVGQIPTTVSYPEFLKRQPQWFQNDVLGPTRAALFRTGEIELSNFVDRKGATITIDLLRKRYSQVFKAAGL